jgi:hypothetical protein
MSGNLFASASDAWCPAGVPEDIHRRDLARRAEASHLIQRAAAVLDRQAAHRARFSFRHSGLAGPADVYDAELERVAARRYRLRVVRVRSAAVACVSEPFTAADESALMAGIRAVILDVSFRGLAADEEPDARFKGCCDRCGRSLS